MTVETQKQKKGFWGCPPSEIYVNSARNLLGLISLFNSRNDRSKDLEGQNDRNFNDRQREVGQCQRAG
jgi:hypothetical protein